VKVPSIVVRHPALAWIAPAAVAVVLAAVAMGAFTSSSSTASLPETNPRALIAGVSAAAKSPSRGYSGTIVVDASLGDQAGDSSASGSTTPTATDGAGALDSFTTMLTGPHTLRFWYGGPERQRVALLRPTSETDFFHVGDDLWEWDSASQVVRHSKASADGSWALPLTFAVLTPQQLAAHALSAIDDTTAVALGDQQIVADRPCYQLVITPQQGQSRIASVRISVDSKTKVPLSVQVYARGGTGPAVDASFTTVRFKHPAPSNFTPPTGHSPSSSQAGPSAVQGDGFTTVVEYAGSAAQLDGMASALLRPVTGTFGSGELLESPLLCLLALADGRVYLGSVDPSALYQAAADGASVATAGTTRPR